MKRIFLAIPLLFLISCSNLDTKKAYSDSKNISVYFSPRGGASDAIINEIDRANKTIDIAIYDFTSRPIYQALIRAKDRGVKIRIVMDSHEAKTKYSKYELLREQGVPIKLLPDANMPGFGNLRALMHNKFAIIDNSIVITGSYNWTASAEKLNYENLLIIRSKELANIYEEEFNKLFKS